MIALVDRMRSMSRSPAFQGWLATLHVSAPPPLCVASSNDRVSDTEPSRAMKSTACPASDVEGSSVIVAVPDSHFRLEMVVFAPPTVNAAGFSTPFGAVGPDGGADVDRIEERLVQRARWGRDVRYVPPEFFTNSDHPPHMSSSGRRTWMLNLYSPAGRGRAVTT